MSDITHKHIKAPTWKPGPFITDDLIKRHRAVHREKLIDQVNPEPDDRTAEGWL